MGNSSNKAAAEPNVTENNAPACIIPVQIDPETENELKKYFGNIASEIGSIGLFYRNTFDSREPISWKYLAENSHVMLSEALNGNVKEQLTLARLYEEGKGGFQNNQEYARNWYTKAAASGSSDAMVALAHMMIENRGGERDDKTAVLFLHKAAAKGHSVAMTTLGFCCAIGKGVEKSEKAAVEWFREASGRGYAPAQHNLGVVYENGLGVLRDDYEAVDYYKKAAAQEFPPSLLSLGRMCYAGKGMWKNNREAEFWFRKFSKYNYELANKELKAIGICEEDTRTRLVDERTKQKSRKRDFNSINYRQKIDMLEAYVPDTSIMRNTAEQGTSFGRFQFHGLELEEPKTDKNKLQTQPTKNPKVPVPISKEEMEIF